jgi:uncharacterized membrane protein YjjP (DUF1212 family)
MSDAHHPSATAAAAGPAPPTVTPQAVAVAAVTGKLGLVLWAGGAALALVGLWQGHWVRFAWAAFASVYGFAVWLAARDTRARAAPAD